MASRCYFSMLYNIYCIMYYMIFCIIDSFAPMYNLHSYLCLTNLISHPCSSCHVINVLFYLSCIHNNLPLDTHILTDCDVRFPCQRLKMLVQYLLTLIVCGTQCYSSVFNILLITLQQTNGS